MYQWEYKRLFSNSKVYLSIYFFMCVQNNDVTLYRNTKKNIIKADNYFQKNTWARWKSGCFCVFVLLYCCCCQCPLLHSRGTRIIVSFSPHSQLNAALLALCWIYVVISLASKWHLHTRAATNNSLEFYSICLFLEYLQHSLWYVERF